MVATILTLKPFFNVFKITENKSDDKTKYGEYLDELINNYDVHSELLIFPDKVDKESIENFKYQTQDGIFDGSYFLYLVCNYDNEKYNKELTRIKNIKTKYRNKIKRPIYLREDQYDAYIAIMDGYNTFEYVLFDKENLKVIYIFNQLFDYKSIKLNRDYIISQDITYNIYSFDY